MGRDSLDLAHDSLHIILRQRFKIPHTRRRSPTADTILRDKFILEAGSLQFLLHDVGDVGADLRLAGTVFEIVAKVAVDDALELFPFLEQMAGLVLEVVDL